MPVFDEGVASGLAVEVFDEADRLNGPENFKLLSEARFSRCVVQAAHKDRLVGSILIRTRVAFDLWVSERVP